MEILSSLTDEQSYALQYDWEFWGRPDQLPPVQWGQAGCFIWMIRTGRGWGKSRTATEIFINAVRYGGYKYPNLVGATADEVRDVMINGETGILKCAAPDFYPEYIPSLKKLI